MCFFCWQHTVFCCVHLAMEGWERWCWLRVRWPFAGWLMRGSHCYCLYFGSRARYPMGRVAPPFLSLTSRRRQPSPSRRGDQAVYRRQRRLLLLICSVTCRLAASRCAGGDLIGGSGSCSGSFFFVSDSLLRFVVDPVSVLVRFGFRSDLVWV